MPLESGLIGYAAWATLALAYKRGIPRAPNIIVQSPRVAMTGGFALLAISALAAIHRFGGPIGVVAWLVQLSVAGVLIVLVLSWRPSLAVGFALPALATGFLLLGLQRVVF